MLLSKCHITRCCEFWGSGGKVPGSFWVFSIWRSTENLSGLCFDIVKRLQDNRHHPKWGLRVEHPIKFWILWDWKDYLSGSQVLLTRLFYAPQGSSYGGVEKRTYCWREQWQWILGGCRGMLPRENFTNFIGKRSNLVTFERKESKN